MLFWWKLQDVDAVLPMDGDAARHGDEADDGFTRIGLAAARHVGDQIPHALNGDFVFGRRRLGASARGFLERAATEVLRFKGGGELH